MGRLGRRKQRSKWMKPLKPHPDSRVAASPEHSQPPWYRRSAGAGTFVLLAALALNKWSLERIVAPDEHLQSTLPIALIVCGQIALLIAAALLWRRSRPLPAVVQTAIVVGSMIAVLTGAYGGLKAMHIIDPSADLRDAWEQVIANEELLLALTPRLDSLSIGALNLKIPDVRSRRLFGDEVLYLDVASSSAGAILISRGAPASGADSMDDDAIAAGLLPAGITRFDWPIAGDRRTENREDLQIWAPLFGEVLYLSQPDFYFITGAYTGAGRDEYESEVGFRALARLRGGGFAALEARQTLLWRPAAGTDPANSESWLIIAWETHRVTLLTIDELMFDERLDRVLSDDDLQRARRSVHEEMALQLVMDADSFQAPHEFFSLPAFDRHPGISVIDVNGDGFDDLFVMPRWGKSLLLINGRDGTYTERAASYGLDIEDHNAAAIFADFDNDGDPDVFIGRTLERSLYLVNDNGRFIDRSDRIDVPLPYFVSSVSATDYDNDGLLDLYVSTYAANEMWEPKDRGFYSTYFGEADRGELLRRVRSRESHVNLRRTGPPNLLLHNAGDGRFVAAEAPELEVWLNTYQSTWADYDDDGDADVYIANDFAPNQLLRNDGGGRFTDVTEPTGTSDIGFGMGVTWGDYDLDGKQDLYVSNMYSKAGRRITSQVDGLDPRLAKMASGNSLFRNNVAAFEKVSGLAPPKLTVESAGWSWGSQFGDVNNDGLLDIYALSGYYTAPGEAEIPVDI